MYAIWQNPGTMDKRSFTMHGMNSKPNTTNPIGFFGTGLKMATAVIARLGGVIYVQDGAGNEYKLSKEATTFRDKEFTVLALVNIKTGDRIELPFTTELAKRWEEWMVVRELECNARDENGSFRTSEKMPKQQTDIVRVIVKCDALGSVAATRKAIFFDLRPDLIDKQSYVGFDVARNSGNQLYMQNILVHRAEKPYALTYNFTIRLDLTEDRTIKYYWQLNSRIDTAFQIMDPKLRFQIIKMGDKCQEWNNLLSDVSSIPPELARELIGYQKQGYDLNDHMKKAIDACEIEKEKQSGITLRDDEQDMADEAIKRLSMLGYSIVGYTIKYVNKLQDNALGKADMYEKTMYISRFNFELGLETLMGTMLEEWVHMEHDLDDCTRSMQDWFVRQSIVNGQRYLRETGVRNYNGPKKE